jgi:hypothetical protein
VRDRQQHRLSLLSVLAFALWGVACEQLPNLAPSAAFIFSPVSPIYAGQTSVVFNAAGSRDADGRIVAYVWDFGDGSPQQSESGSTVAHVFPDTSARCLDITYSVLLTTVDDRDERSTSSAQVKVTELPAAGSLECKVG